MPIALGYLAVSFAFGISSVIAGLSWLEATLISLLNLTSAGQLAGMPIIAMRGSLLELAATQLVINSRYSLMSVSLSQKLGLSVSLADRFFVGFCNTDEIYAVATSYGGRVGRRYMIGLGIPPIIGWTLGTLLGAIAGDILPAILVTSLSVAMYAMFIAIVVPRAKEDMPTLLCVVIAVALSCMFAFVPIFKVVPSGFVIIIIALTASLLMALVHPVDDEEDADPCRENGQGDAKGAVDPAVSLVDDASATDPAPDCSCDATSDATCAREEATR